MSEVQGPRYDLIRENNAAGRLEAAERQASTFVHKLVDATEEVKRLTARIAALEAENRRLVEALESIERKADVARLGLTRHGVQDLKIVQVRDIARAALASASSEGRALLAPGADAGAGE